MKLKNYSEQEKWEKWLTAKGINPTVELVDYMIREHQAFLAANPIPEPEVEEGECFTEYQERTLDHLQARYETWRIRNSSLPRL